MQAILNTRENKENASNFSTMVENYFLVQYFVHWVNIFDAGNFKHKRK